MRWLILLAFVPLVYSHDGGYNGHRLISIEAKSREDVEFLNAIQENPEFAELDFWTDPSIIRPTDIRVPPSVYGKLRAAFGRASKTFKVLNENLQQAVEEETEMRAQAKRNRNPDRLSYCNHTNEYCTLAEIEFMMTNLKNEFPNRVTVMDIGYSYENRAIKAVKIVEDVAGEPKDAVWIEAGTHPREWIAIASAVHLMDQLARNPSDKTALMLNRNDWYIVLVHNPDGYVYTHDTYRYWRKNRQPCSKRYVGTDLNRNWAADWGEAGTSSQCYGETYPGESAFSAPETRALRDAVNGTKDVLAFFSIHAYAELMLVPFAFNSTKPARYDQLMDLAEKMMNELSKVDGKKFKVGTPPDTIGVVSGGAYDYMYLQGIPWSYTYELRPSGNLGYPGFHLNETLIHVAVDELLTSLWGFAVHNSGWPEN